jgi:hypothetical protein
MVSPTAYEAGETAGASLNIDLGIREPWEKAEMGGDRRDKGLLWGDFREKVCTDLCPKY